MLEQFDLALQPGIDRKVIRELVGLKFVERSENAILLSLPGVGKRHTYEGKAETGWKNSYSSLVMLG